MTEESPTRSVALELAEERNVIQQGYDFLDEKRALLAAELLRQLDVYQDREQAFIAALRKARQALSMAVLRHGFDDLQVYPPLKPDNPAPSHEAEAFLGVTLMEMSYEPGGSREAFAGLDSSPQAHACREHFLKLLSQLAELASLSGNLERLSAEYRRTEKRARALENVILPELEGRLKNINEHLEAFAQEEAIRARLASKTQARAGNT